MNSCRSRGALVNATPLLLLHHQHRRARSTPPSISALSQRVHRAAPPPKSSACDAHKKKAPYSSTHNHTVIIPNLNFNNSAESTFLNYKNPILVYYCIYLVVSSIWMDPTTKVRDVVQIINRVCVGCDCVIERKREGDSVRDNLHNSMFFFRRLTSWCTGLAEEETSGTESFIVRLHYVYLGV